MPVYCLKCNNFSFIILIVSTSDLLQFPDLQALEIRGTRLTQNLIFYIDEEMKDMKYLNVEAIKLISDEKMAKKRSKNEHPSETYDYVPESERFTYNVTIEIEEDVEIVPYDVYLQELANAKRITFYGWENLEVLRIHNCRFDEIHWEMFDGLSKLQHLSLEHNQIKIIPPFAFYGALHIKTLSLARNNILNLHYLALAGLLELEHLDLSVNNLTKLSETTFPPFPSLKIADLRENPIQFILPMTFGIMNSTKELIIGSQATAFDLTVANGAFLSLDQLNSLNLLNVTASSLYQTMFTGLKQLERLKLRGNILRIEYDAFAEMPRLKELIMSGCGIFEISMDAFYGIKSLRFIDLSNNQLSVIAPGLFDEQKKLQEIYLQNNQLQKLPRKFFNIATLKLVRLIENPWICSCSMSDWNQAITNSIRSAKLSWNADEHCIRNSKNGRIDHCNTGVDNFPRYSYGFDNRLSPLCQKGLNDRKQRDIYHVLRHTIKCAPSTLSASKQQMEKQRSKNKLDFTLEKLSRTNKFADKFKSSTSIQQWNERKMRRMQIDSKIKRTISQNAKILNEQAYSNNIANYR